MVVYYGQQNKETSRILRLVTEGACKKSWNKLFANELYRSESADSECVYRNPYSTNPEFNGRENIRRGRTCRVNDAEKELMAKLTMLTPKEKRIILAYAIALLSEQEAFSSADPTASAKPA